MTSAPKSSAAGFVDLINDAYREIMKAESGALPHALRCGDYLNRAKESVKSERRQKRSEWLNLNCPDISQETASVYMRLDEHKDLVQQRYFNPLYRPISNGGPEAMLWDLQRMELGDWHPREIPDSLLKGTALAQQQTLTLPPIEQWYLWLLENGEIPGALINWDPAKYPDKKSRPRHVFSDSLLGHAAKGQEVAP